MNIFRLIRRTRPADLERVQICSTESRKLSVASFIWSDDDLTLKFNVQFLSFAIDSSGNTCADLKVLDHGLQIACVIEGNELDAILYLGNYFIVPQHLRRRGLARAVLLACLQAFQHAAFGQVLLTQRIRLEGTFVGDGAKFSRAACGGIQPTKAQPALIDMGWLGLARAQLQIRSAPTQFS